MVSRENMQIVWVLVSGVNIVILYQVVWIHCEGMEMGRESIPN